MKKILLILGWLFLSAAPLLAQDDDDQEEGAEKIRDKMNEFIQKRLDLSKDESSKFTPVFIRYFQEWRQTLRDTKGLPTLDRQQKVIELQVPDQMDGETTLRFDWNPIAKRYHVESRP